MEKFMINSNVLEKLAPKIELVAEFIKDTIKNKKPIFIRHHSDADGYIAAVALERAIFPLLYKRHARERDIYHYYSRMPSRTPFYDYEDATRDLTSFLQDIARFEHKTPLIIIVDTGSSLQDYASIAKVKIYGAKVIVIDHHPSSKEITEIVDVHINPHHIGSAYDFSAGMLCAEIAKRLNPEIDSMEYFAAIAGTADKVKSKELDEYLQLCKKQGYELKHIKEVGECLDFEAFYLGFMESNQLVNDILGADPGKQEKLLSLIKDEMGKKRKAQLDILINYAIVELSRDKVFVKIDLGKTKKEGEYPPNGKAAGMLHDFIKSKNNLPTITIGYTEKSMTFRCSTELEKFDVNEIIALIKEKIPNSMADGGGHKCAGSISFIPAAFNEIMELVEKYVKGI